jgi:hypothetical protein
MLDDVQSWIDAPAGNDGWEIASSTEGDPSEAQRFYSTEAGASAPSLSVTYACKPGFVASGTACATATASVPTTPPWALIALAAALVAGGACFYPRAVRTLGRRTRSQRS